MQPISDAARLTMLRAAGAVLVHVEGRPFYGLYQRPYTAAAVGDLSVDSRAPSLVCRSSDAGEIASGTPVDIPNESTPLRVRTRQPDDPAPGFTTLILRS